VKFLLHPEADEEFAGAVQYYSKISPELGVRPQMNTDKHRSEGVAKKRELPNG
jgi:hypothetical protein